MFAVSRKRIVPVESDSDEEKVRKLLELLLVFGRHRRSCHCDPVGWSCNCDWDEIRSALEKL